MNKILLSLSILVLHSTSSFAQKASQLDFVYVGNMGVLISNGKQSLAIDAFHVFYNAAYQHPSAELVKDIMEGNFDDYPAVEMALFTHVHGDHYYKGYGTDFVALHEQNWLVAANQSCEEAREILAGKRGEQIKEVPYDHSVLNLEKGGIKVKAFRLDHANPSRHSNTQNVAFVITMDGCKSLHVGDTEWDAVKRIFPKHKVLAEKIDVAILPYWMVSSRSHIAYLKEYINPKHLLVTHIPPGFDTSDQQKIKSLFPQAHLFMELEKDKLTLE